METSLRRIARSLDVAVITASILCGTAVTIRTIGCAFVHRESSFVHRAPPLPPTPPWADTVRARRKQTAYAHTAESESPAPFPGVHRIGRYSYELSRPALFKWLQGDIDRDPFIAPGRDDLPIGFRLASVRPDGLPAALGFRKGDVVQAINGVLMTSPDRALAAYAKVKETHHLSVALDRAGFRFTIEVSTR